MHQLLSATYIGPCDRSEENDWLSVKNTLSNNLYDEINISINTKLLLIFHIDAKMR